MSPSQVLILLGAALAVWAAVAAARRTRIPTAVVLVVAGTAIGFLPFVPTVSLSPRLVLDCFLPPLISYVAYSTSPRSLLEDGFQLGLLAIGLVALTAGAVAAAAHEIGHLSWPMSFVLGAAVGPTDAVAAASIAGRIGLPERVTTLLQSEGMCNDATALVLYGAAVTAATSGKFSLSHTVISIVFAATAGCVFGLAVGVLGRQLMRRIDDAPLEIVLSVILAYAAYLPCRALGASGIIAGVTAGVYLGWHQSSSHSALTRLQARGFWDTADFFLNGALFVLLGLSLRTFTASARGPVGRLLVAAVGVIAAVIIVRLFWTAVIPTALRHLRWVRTPRQPRREQIVIGWSGMRGGLTLAAVLAVPRVTGTGVPLAGRDDVVYLAFAVIFATLIGQGLTLPFITKRLGVTINTNQSERSRSARAEILQSAHHVLEGEALRGDLLPGVTEEIRTTYRARSRRVQDMGADMSHHAAELALRRELVTSQRRRLREMRSRGDVDSSTFRAIQHELDLEEARLFSESEIVGKPNSLPSFP